MGSICGVLNFDREKKVDEDVLGRMSSVMKHRGTDYSGIYLKDNLGLGVNCLYLSDNIQQPAYNEDKSICVVLDGEVWNYVDIRELLIKKRHNVSTNSSAEIIVHLYEEFGEDCVAKLEGGFTFALWDSKQKKLLLARDHGGQKPLYYLLDNNRIVFGSELKSILECDGITPEVSMESLDVFLTYGYIPTHYCILKGVKKIEPGHFLVCSNGKTSVLEYWDFRYGVSEESESYCAEHLYSLTKKSVQTRLERVKNVSFGAFLSGGTDSSTIVGMLSTMLDRPLKTFVVGFKEEEFSEFPFARIVAKHFGTEHHEVEVTTKMALSMLPDFVWHYDEPFADVSAIPTYYGSKATRESVKAVFTGDAPDQLLGGSGHHLKEQIRRKHLPIPDFLRIIISKLTSNFPLDVVDRSNLDRIKRLIKMESYPLEKEFGIRGAYFTEDVKRELYLNDLRKSQEVVCALGVSEGFFKKTTAKDFLDKIFYVDVKMFLMDNLMTKVDRASMAVGLETIKPFLDKELMDFVGRIPSRFKIKGTTGRNTKYILKQAISNLVPIDVIEKKKQGFEPPLVKWLRGELKGFAQEILFDSKTRQRGYFNFNYIEQIWNEHQKKTADHTMRIWELLVFEMWYRYFIEGEKQFLNKIEG
ncbi:asparagine synthase (glutamine-hydrolyzing) [Candidatus Desantisbacteria bacterium CG_4_9_14_3_um_filter_40_11]|uniref:asparagine synthase (glutamine-hydrolyzing) n=3 Tax=unclassified Candidatus Desantisiibacteriota TaxID=3106372 RepID=A0A2M7P3I6_9BACT|nr:MAG: asparagine synthase (glutamine-hydrolyzing) [Candidatus Desantisbacteria bacterium CG_4_10_14_3_um_filter_40_18]PJB29351.1 MAG: asparagine synthase (glutamine-hydrolyzing) [Candidatus Desantisbacteria bacterium CG_4_9_14_3_um_filter_40_11]